MQEAPTVPRRYGEFNLWDLFDTEVSGEVPCNRASVFFHLLFSEGTHGARRESTSAPQGYIDILLYGPVTDDASWDVDADGKPISGRGRKLTKTEVDGGTEYQGFEATACLKTRFRLYTAHVQQHFKTTEDKDVLVARLRELGINGTSLDVLCKTLGLRRLR